MSHQRIHNIWCSMRRRCEKPKCSGYWKYGAKGIRVCDEWKSFDTFMAWAYENGYSDDLTIDRIDPNGNYEPSNCRWVTQKVQQNNRSNNVHITYNGETHTIEEWSKITGIPNRIIYERNKRNWQTERIFTQEVRKSSTKGKKIANADWTSVMVYFDKNDNRDLLTQVKEMMFDDKFNSKTSKAFGRHSAAEYNFEDGTKALYWQNETGTVIDFRKKSQEKKFYIEDPDD